MTLIEIKLQKRALTVIVLVRHLKRGKTEMTFAERLKKLRSQTGLSQKDFAEEAGIAQFAMNRLEKGNRQPDVETLVALRKRFGVNLNDLLTGEELSTDGKGIPLFSCKDLCLPDEERVARRTILHPDLSEGGFAYRLTDNSMFPLLSYGDIVVVSDKTTEIGDLILCRDETMKITVRRLCCRDETVNIAVPENSDYRSSVASDLKAFGKVEAYLKVTVCKV
jgi:transcriptional regulator with XRE-family HTH domain